MLYTYTRSLQLAVSLLFCAVVAHHNGPTIHTTQGRIYGVHLSEDVDAFLGIPYAAPPIGDLRFEPPQPWKCTSSEWHIDGTQLRAACIQHRYNNVLKDYLSPDNQSEDCLHLNIFVPRVHNDTKPFPSLVWFYGGSMSEGANNLPIYNARALAASQQMIVIVPNYRLNLFGFPNAKAIDPNKQNLGIRDQRAAMEWVRDNIKWFGGDATTITIGGHSAGGDSALGHTYWYKDDPIARAVFVQSGVPIALGQYDDMDYIRVAETTGCRNLSDGLAELKCLKKIPAASLKNAISNNTLDLFGSPLGGNPIVDNITHYSAQGYAARGESGSFARIPVFIGMNNDEGDSVVNWLWCGVSKTSASIVRTYLFECPMSSEADYRTKFDVPIWRYRYMAKFPRMSLYPWLGSYHTAEIPYVLGSYPIVDAARGVNPDEMAASDFFQDAVGFFVRDPYEGLSKHLGWPIYNTKAPTLIELFENNTATFELVDPQKYNDICKDPPVSPVAEFGRPPPQC